MADEANVAEQERPDVAERVAEMEARAAEAGPEKSSMRQVGGHVGSVREELGAQQLVEAAAQSPKATQAMTPEERVDALEWLLDDGESEQIDALQTWEINLGSDDLPKMAQWTVRPITSDEMTFLRQQGRKEAGVNRQARRAGQEPEIDASMLNLRMVALATIEPDLQHAAKVKGVAAADPLHGPVMLLRSKFARRPGLVDQIAGKIMLFSGYDEADVRRASPEMTMMEATKNS
jgi:hypothetical protein